MPQYVYLNGPKVELAFGQLYARTLVELRSTRSVTHSGKMGGSVTLGTLLSALGLRPEVSAEVGLDLGTRVSTTENLAPVQKLRIVQEHLNKTGTLLDSSRTSAADSIKIDRSHWLTFSGTYRPQPAPDRFFKLAARLISYEVELTGALVNLTSATYETLLRFDLAAPMAQDFPLDILATLIRFSANSRMAQIDPIAMYYG
jgi:hypothetical protein